MSKVGHMMTGAHELSRSTSAGSSSDEGGLEQSLTYPAHSGSCSYLPEYDYPTPLIVRNTFIDTPLDRMHSLDGYLSERRVQSCPVENPPTTDDEEPEAVPSAAHQLRRSLTTGAAALAAAASETAARMTGWWPSSTGSDDTEYLEETFHVVHSPKSPAHPSSIAAAPPVLLLSQMIEAPAMDPSQIPLGSPDMPTMGSAGHWMGDCKPCAFYHKRGCTNGVQCNFCHICDSGEKKRRQKEKVQQLKEMRRQGVSL